jgi:hypothetical protein
MTADLLVLLGLVLTQACTGYAGWLLGYSMGERDGAARKAEEINRKLGLSGSLLGEKDGR